MTTRSSARLDPTEERRLVDAARGGDQRAYAQLVTASRGHLWAVCLQICGNEHDAEDALQEALTAAWRHLDKFDGRARFSTWAHRIAANAALARVRRRREVPEEDAGAQEAASAPGVGERVTTVLVVRRALAELSPEFREAIVLREYGDLTYQEIADHQGIGVQTVKSRINRARGALREALADVA